MGFPDSSPRGGGWGLPAHPDVPTQAWIHTRALPGGQHPVSPQPREAQCERHPAQCPTLVTVINAVAVSPSPDRPDLPSSLHSPSHPDPTRSQSPSHSRQLAPSRVTAYL